MLELLGRAGRVERGPDLERVEQRRRDDEQRRLCEGPPGAYSGVVAHSASRPDRRRPERAHLRPKPNTKPARSSLVGSSSPSAFRNLSGLNFSGSGNSSVLCASDLCGRARQAPCAVLWEEREGVPEVRHDDGPGGDEVAVVVVVGGRAVREPDRRADVPPRDFLEERGSVWQRRPVLKLWEAVVSYDAVQFLLGFLLHLGVHRNGQQERLQRVICLCAQTRSPQPAVHRWG